MTSPQRVDRPERPGEKREVVRVRLLGGFSVSVGARAVEENRWRRRKAASLIKLLALAPRHRLHRERVMDLLWPGFGVGAASNNLHRTLHLARRLLEPAPGAASRYLRLRDDRLVLCPDEPLWVDVEAFEDAVATARRTREPAAYRAAVELYSGELLPEDRYERWAEEKREGLRRSYLTLLVEAAGMYEGREEYGPAAEALQEVVANESAHEEAHAGLMRLYALRGWRHRALAQYERLRDALRDLDSEPGPESRRLHAEISAGRFPPIHRSTIGAQPAEPPGIHRHNLPVVRTSFVGREREIREVKRLLSMTRLLTLTGAGGCGKTRLALEVASDLVGAYPDGVWLVELASLSEGVPRAVAAALGVREQTGEALSSTLADHLRTKDLLLVLDNCEHLIQACASLVDILLDSCPRLRVLATSREPLNVAGEAVWSVPQLSLPDPKRSPTIEELEGYESTRLFVERALYRPSSFVPTPGNARAVARICRALDGMPLAIELAAARVGALAVEQVSERLGDSLKLLTGGNRTAAPRQQTLRGALDWSHGLLEEPEKRLFRRLSVFADGCTLEAAETVCSGEGIEGGEVLDTLSRLVDKSLVLVSERGGEARYRLLETVRQYGREKLESSGEGPETRRRHAGFFMQLAQRAEPELTGARQQAWLDRLETELDNLRTALKWSSEGEDPEVGLRLASSLWQFCHTRGHYGEGREWLEEALAGGNGSPATLRAKALTGAGVLTFLQCDYARAEALIEESLAVYRDLEDGRGVASALQTLGSISRERGRYDRAVAFHEESLTLQRGLGNQEGVARSLDGLGFVAWLQRDHERAEALCSEALALYRGLEDAEGVAWSLVNLGAAAQHRGDLGRAAELLDECLTLSRRAGYKEGIAWSLNQLGVVQQRRGDHERATALLRESLEVHRDLGDRWRAASVMEALASCVREHGRHEQAARLLGAAEALRKVIGAPLPPCERPDYEINVSALRAEMGEKAFAKGRSEGRGTSLEQAVDYAPGKGGETPAKSAPRERPPVALTRREREVASLVARGLTNRRVAEELNISEHTIITHVRAIRKKLGFHSRAEIAAWVTEQQMEGGWDPDQAQERSKDT